MASASEELSSTSQEITANSEETSTQAQVVSSSSEQGPITPISVRKKPSPGINGPGRFHILFSHEVDK